MALTERTHKRKGTPRSRAGCSTCRQRKIKCNEQRPSCSACLRSGWTCPGYASALDPSPPHFDSCRHQRLLPNQPPILSYSIPSGIPGSQSDRRALHYFAIAAGPDIGGHYFRDFWTRSILQRCQHDAPVRHAVAALSGLHREYVACGSHTTFAASEDVVRAYTRAMKAIRRYAKTFQATLPDLQVVMICSAVFFCFEVMRGEQEAALTHLRCGGDVIRQWQRQGQHGHPEQAQLVDLFARMDLQASSFEGRQILAARPTEQSLLTDRLGDVLSAAELHTVAHSQLLPRCSNFLFRRAQIRRRGGMLDNSTRADDMREQQSLLIDLHAWNAHLSTLSVHGENDRLRRTIARSRLHITMLLPIIQHAIPSQGPHRPNILTRDDKADDLLCLAKEAISVNDIEEMQREGQRSFCLHLGVVAPLLLIALQTRRCGIRAACRDLLRACRGRREVLFDAETVLGAVEVLGRRYEGPEEGTSLLDRMGERAEDDLRQAVEAVVVNGCDAAPRFKALASLLVLAGVM